MKYPADNRLQKAFETVQKEWMAEATVYSNLTIDYDCWFKPYDVIKNCRFVNGAKVELTDGCMFVGNWVG